MTQDAAPPKVGALLEKVMERLELRGSEGSKPVPLPWPMAEFVYGGGLWPGLHLLFGRVGSGRSQLAAQAAKHAAAQRAPTLYVSLEQDAATQVIARWLALEAGIAWSDVYLGRLEKDDWVKVAAAEASLDELPLHLIALPEAQWAPPLLDRWLGSMRALYPDTTSSAQTMLVVLDGFFLLRREGAMSAEERLMLTVKEAADAALRHNAALLLILGQAREEDVAKSGDEEVFGQGDPARFLGPRTEPLDPWATSVAVLGRPGFGGEEAHLGVSRQRFGRGGWVELVFDGTEFGGGFE